MDYSQYFRYEDGKIYWIAKTNFHSHNTKIWFEAGTNNGCGYKRVMVNGKHTMVHHIVWEMHNGEIPEGMEIDHADHDRQNNRIENLRLVSRAINMQNKSIYKNNSTGACGVSYRKDTGKWRAIITVNKRKIYIGNYISFEEALSARLEAERLYGFHGNHGL